MKEMAQKTTFQYTKLEKLRKAKKVTQQELADAIKPDVKAISRELIKDFEIGSRIPKIDVVVAFAKYFKVSTDFLLGLTEASSQDLEIRKISDYTGLSEKVIDSLHRNYENPGTLNKDYLGRPYATDEMLWKMISQKNFCLTLTEPIIQKARRKAANEIAIQIIDNPKLFVAENDKAEVILQEINEHLSLAMYNLNNERNDIDDDTIFQWNLEDVVEILGRYVGIQTSVEFDRFEATQQYLEAYDSVIANYPDNDLVDKQKSIILARLDLRLVQDEDDAGK